MKYRVITRGTARAGYDLDQVKRQFASHFRVSADLADKLFAGNRVCLKSNLDARTGQAYLDRLTDMGLAAELEPMAGSLDTSAESEQWTLEDLQQQERTVEHDSIVCPSCGSYQSHSPRCIYCRLTFAAAPPKHHTPAKKRTPRSAQRSPRSFYEAVATAPRYPISGSGPYIIAGGTLFLLLAGAALWIPILGLLIGLVVIGYLCSYMLEIVKASASGRPDPPDWPEFQHWGHIFMPLLYVGGTFAFSFFPAVAYYALFLDFSGEPDFVFWFLSAAGIFYFPMALLAVALTRLFRAASPFYVIPSIVRVWRNYLLACGVMALAYLCSFIAREVAGDSVPLLGAVAGNALSIYFMLLEMHIIGILFFTHEQELNWFE